MTLRLILTRHAKSSWTDPMMDDIDRPLNRRGRAAAGALGAWLAGKGYVPDLALVSPAERTRETWDLLRPAFDPAPEARVVDALYHAEPETLLATLRAAEARSVMILAHNPGIAFFAQALLETPPEDARFDRYPTGTTLVADFALEGWEGLAWRMGRMVDLVFPRDLA